MSVVIAVKEGNRVWFGADTQSTCDTDKYNHLSCVDYKVNKLENGMVLSWTGATAMKQFIFAHDEWFTPDEKGRLTKKHIVTKIIPQIYQALDEEGMLEKGDDGYPPLMTGTIFLAYKDRLFEICRDFEVIRYEDYQASGSGARAVQYGLSRLDKTKDVNEQLLHLLRISEKHDSCVSAPFIFIDTQDLKYTVKEK